jgi:hypothetical protein
MSSNPPTGHVAGSNAAAIKSALPDLIGAAAALVSTAGLPSSDQPAAIKSVIDHALQIVGGVGAVMEPQFAPLISAGVTVAVALIDRAGGAPVSAADLAAAMSDIASAHAANQTIWVDPNAPAGTP